MFRSSEQKQVHGFTLLELLFVMAIITVLASLLMGPAVKMLQRARADQWSNRAHVHLQETVERLNREFQGRQDFPVVTLDDIEARGWLTSAQLRFLRQPEVTFTPFSGADPDDKIVISVELPRGFLTGGCQLTQTKGAITRVPD